jgi:hypothetical protein
MWSSVSSCIEGWFASVAVTLCNRRGRVDNIGESRQGKIDPEYVARVIEHYCHVNQVTERTFWKDLDRANERWRCLSALQWISDFGEYSEWLLAILTKRLAIIKRQNELAEDRKQKQRINRRKQRA